MRNHTKQKHMKQQEQKQDANKKATPVMKRLARLVTKKEFSVVAGGGTGCHPDQASLGADDDQAN